jgi:hypothetical protein
MQLSQNECPHLMMLGLSRTSRQTGQQRLSSGFEVNKFEGIPMTAGTMCKQSDTSLLNSYFNVKAVLSGGTLRMIRGCDAGIAFQREGL